MKAARRLGEAQSGGDVERPTARNAPEGAVPQEERVSATGPSPPVGRTPNRLVG